MTTSGEERGDWSLNCKEMVNNIMLSYLKLFSDKIINKLGQSKQYTLQKTIRVLKCKLRCFNETSQEKISFNVIRYCHL